MTERGPITSAHYNVAALKQYLAEQCPGAESYHFVFAKPGEPREAAVHLTCPLTTLFQILIDKQDSGSMVYVEIAPDNWEPINQVSISASEIVVAQGLNGHRREWRFPIAGGVPRWEMGSSKYFLLGRAPAAEATP